MRITTFMASMALASLENILLPATHPSGSPELQVKSRLKRRGDGTAMPVRLGTNRVETMMAGQSCV
jgi:hypothetical protein